ncbi:MAG: RHS repeat protein, partial [Planctomycetes bacterium]|nr:RHS repeat protein [Planctomycetota bacterium]
MLYEHPTYDAKDVVYLVYGADRYIEFNRVNSTSTEYKSKNGAAGIVEFIVGGIPDDGEPDLYKYTDQRGWQFYFFGFDNDSLNGKGQFWKFVIPKPGGNHVAYVHSTDAETAAWAGYNSDGNIIDARDTSGRLYNYEYASGRLASVTVGSGVNETARVTYTYHDGLDAYGHDGDLKLVTISTPLTEDTNGYDEDKWLVKKKYYRYWTNETWSSGSPGLKHQIKYIVDFEGTRNFDWGENGTEDPPVLNDGFLTASDTDLKAYASAYFEYEDEDEGNNKHKRITEAWFNGECGCSGAANGTYKFTYHENDDFPGSPAAGYDEEWFTRTVVEQPQITNKTADGAVESYITQYFDEVGQPLSRVITDDDPAGASNLWATHVVRDVTNGWIDTIHSPANVTAYTHNEGGGDPDGSFTTSTSIGLVTEFSRASTGVLVGFLEDVKHKKGTSGSAYLDLTLTHTTRTLETGDLDVVRPMIASQRIYTTEITSGTTDSRLTSIAYTWHSSTSTNVLYITPNVVTTTYPTVTTGNNGSGSATTSKIFLNETGQTEWQKTTDAKINYWLYIDEGGRLDKSIQDADTTHTDFTDPGIDIPTGFASDGNDELHIVSCFGYVGGGGTGLLDGDGGCSSGAGGDSITTGTGPTRVTYSARLKDGRFIQLSFPNYVNDTSDEYYGPVGCSVINLAGKVESQGTISLDTNGGEYTTEAPTDFVDENQDNMVNAITYVDPTAIGTLNQISTRIYDETGLQLNESRFYFTSVGLSYNFPGGTKGTDFDATLIGYNDQGRTVRIEDPTGQIQRTVFDSLGRTTQQWTGTNDNAFDGGSSPGPDNMVKTVEMVYDSGGDEANSYLTKQTLFVENSATDDRETTFQHDLRGRVLLTTNPAAPHVLAMYDNLGRQLASGLYSSVTSIVVGTDIPTTESDNRLALSQTSYDERGQVWQTKSHKIGSGGSDDDNILTQNWFDDGGNLIKVDGSQLMKIGYNRLDQRTHTYILAVDNDSVYADADDVTGDIVLQESQTVIDVNSGITLMTATIDRDHDDYGGGENTGALDDNSDDGTPDPLKYTAADINGQIQITSYWYDSINRLETVANYGNNGGSDFDRDGLVVPTRSDTVLVTSYTYNADGTLLEISDPMSLETRYIYDAAARQTVVTSNYVNGTPSGLNGDDDAITRYVYDNGQRTKLWVDIYPVDTDGTPDAEDQVTTYTYGVDTDDDPGASKFASNRLLRTIQYPDGSPNTVTFAYNAQGQQIWVEDQENIEITTDYDDLGREIHRRVTEIDNTQFNDDVLRISTVYDSLSRVSTVTQYDAATAGSATDQVKYTYDGWSNITNFEQDNDSVVGEATVNDYEIRYDYAKATTGRNTIRRILMRHYYASTLKKTVTYQYLSTGSLHDNDVSRVTQVRLVVGLNTTLVADYDYLGVGQVVGTDYPEPDVFSNLYTTGGYTDNLDNFRRVTSNIWYKDLSTDREIYDVDPSYNRNSNITSVVDNINVDASSVGIYDAVYTLDNLNRLTNAQWGDWDGTTFTNEQREKIWTLTQTGNWDMVQLDLDNDDVYDSGTGEYKDDRIHNVVNELTTRDIYDDASVVYNLAYDDLGELTDDGENYIYKYDAFGRLIEIS